MSTTGDEHQAVQRLLAPMGRQFVRLRARLEQVELDYDLPPEVTLQIQGLAKEIEFVAVPVDVSLKQLEERIRTVTFHITNLESSFSKKYPPRKKNVAGCGNEILQPVDRTTLRNLNRQIAFASYLLGDVHLSSVPISVDIDPSITCNFRCRICHHSMSQRDKRQFLPISVIDKLDPLFERLSEVHIFGGGEPTLSPTLDYLLEKIHRCGINGDILTNGSTLGKRALPLAHLSAIGISFDGSTERTFQTIRNGSRFKRLLARIRSFKREYPHTSLYFNSVFSRVNIDELPGIVTIAGELGVASVSIHRMIPLYPHHAEMELTSADIPQINEALLAARAEAARLGVVLSGDLDPGSLPNREESLSRSPAERKEYLLTMLAALAPAQDDGTLPVSEAIDRAVAVVSEIAPSWKRHEARTLAKDSASGDESDCSEQALRAILADLENRLRAHTGASLRAPSCAVPWFRASVRADGTVRPCSIMNTRMGCVESQDGFQPIWNGTPYKELRTVHASHAGSGPSCPSCEGCQFPERTIWSAEITEYAKSFGITLIR